MLEQVAGGYAFRAAREAAEACARLFERPGRARAVAGGLETVAIVAYLGPVSRPEIARIRGVAADSAVASLVERGLIAEAGRESGPGGAVRYRVTALFERVFGLESLAALPRLDDLGDDQAAIRDRLLEVASRGVVGDVGGCGFRLVILAFLLTRKGSPRLGTASVASLSLRPTRRVRARERRRRVSSSLASGHTLPATHTMGPGAWPLVPALPDH